ncbi:MAG TPA: GrpB family protein [Pirellulales bacterium]|nr:GrpB family protein [Pirellulales bacterium]
MKFEPTEIGLIGGVEKREIQILDYDPRWQDKYQTHSARISAAVGATALRIEHIGSTSVPGLAAKPIIDILVVVADSAIESAYLPRLESAGYVLRVREPEFHEHRMFRTPERDVHIHVFSLGSPEIERYLVFRDRLRTNSDDRLRYEKTKRDLAARSWDDMNAYADAKTEVVEGILARARAEAERARVGRPS